MEIAHFTVAIVTVVIFLATLTVPLISQFNGGSKSDSNAILGIDRSREKALAKYIQDRYQPRHKRFFLSPNCGTVAGVIDCEVCKFVIQFLKSLAAKNTTQDDVVYWSTKICVWFKIEDERVCKAVTKEFKDELFGVSTRLVLSPEEACGILFGDNCGKPYDPSQMWNVTFPKTPKPPVDPPKPPKAGSPKLRVLHLTDIHLDPEYQVGSNVQCGEPLCCRKDDGMAEDGKQAAGKWGTVHGDCDLPRITFENLLQHLSSIKDQFDYVMFTGDLPPHNIWNQSRQNQITSLQTYTDLLLKYLPGKPVYNTLGNHESAPVNSFPPDFIKGNLSMDWYYPEVAKNWGKWLPTDTVQTILKGGFYTTSPHPGFRIVSLNMNYCNNGNAWLLINTTDPNGQLRWLINVLQQAENRKEKVHIIGHISPGLDSCLKAWSWNYYKIINRYENTVVGQFFGHTHQSFYQIIYDNVTFSRPLSVMYLPGSVTTYSDLNPGYRIYEMDGWYNGSSWSVIDYQNYFLNLTEANLGKVEWKFEYSAKEAYGLNNLFPKDWDSLIYRMKSNNTLFNIFYKHLYKSANTPECTGSCKNQTLCSLRTGRSQDTSFCKTL